MADKLHERLYVSTVSDDAAEVAVRHGIGIEVACFCTADNMDNNFAHWDSVAREMIAKADRHVFHAPFNELCPSAIDPLIVDVARRRYRQAHELMRGYGIKRMVVHSGYIPYVYFKEYFVERSVEFWRELLDWMPQDTQLYLENVLEDGPELLRDVVAGVDDPRMRLCLDIGHANTVVSNQPTAHWIDVCAPYLGHVHIHNNFREYDNHNGLSDGLIDMRPALERLLEKCPTVTVTLETLHTEPSIAWLRDNGFLE